MHALKYRGYTAVAGQLAAPLLAEAVEEPGGFDAVVPMPLHRARLRRCGFNRAALLARGLADRINTSVSDTLQIVRSTRDQVELSPRRGAGTWPARSRPGPARGAGSSS